VRQRASGQSRNGSRTARATQAAALLADLKGNTDLAWLIERVVRNDLPWVVVPDTALEAWEKRDPIGWKKVAEWLATNDIAVIRMC
jgi:hypothetical protein